MNHYLGVDIGGTNIVCGIVSEEGKLIDSRKIATEADRGVGHVTRRIAEAAGELLRANPGCSYTAAGVGVPGFVDHEQGVAKLSVNLGWKDVPLAAELGQALGVPVRVGHDVRMYVYGEAVAGAGRGFGTVLGITLGTGVAAAMVVDGRIHYGRGNMAGEIGHYAMPGIDRLCPCGLTGCLETIASATGIVRQAQEALAAGERSVLADWFPAGGEAELTAYDVSRAYDAGDELAQRIMHYTGTMLARALAAAISLTSPDVIVFGGGASRAGDRLFAPMREELNRLLHPMYRDGLLIVQAELLEDAGVIGSALFAQQH